jgi:F-type H+-transporting ATPase subunit gamma
MKAVKRRIVSVKSTQQIMKAMNLVAASKLQKTKGKLEIVRPMFSDIKNLMDGIRADSDGSDESVYAEKRDVKNIVCVVITSDRGLCGSYNINISKEALGFINKSDKQVKVVAIGTKGWEFFRRRGKDIPHRFSFGSETVPYEDAEDIGHLLTALYTSGQADEIYIAYTKFNTALSHKPSVVKLLPVGTEDGEEEGEAAASSLVHHGKLMSYDPDAGAFMSYAVPMYVNLFLYGSMIESAVCEHAARMTSMDAASRNAAEIIEDLTLAYNRKRQGMITQEITEIVGGANALQ